MLIVTGTEVTVEVVCFVDMGVGGALVGVMVCEPVVTVGDVAVVDDFVVDV